MGWKAFEAGDLLIEGRAHAVMWVAGEKPIVHNVDKGQFVGVIRQSAKYLEERTSPPTVYRYEIPQVATKAAEFAIDWSTKPSDLQIPEPKPEKVVLRSPYSHGRMSGGLDHTTSVPWSVDALFRALKSIARKRDGVGLSPNHGVSCSQFVTFCYQAAAIESLIGTVLPAELIDAMRNPGHKEAPIGMKEWVKKDYLGSTKEFWREKAFDTQRKVFRSLKQDRDFIANALGSYVDVVQSSLPKAMRVDAKVTDVEKLLDDLQADDSGFAQLGKAKKNTQQNDTWMIET